jgi:heat-inducible transcriptional repressor
MNTESLTDRENQVLEAIIRHYVLFASPAASCLIAKEKGFDLSAASIRNVMVALEERGLITHPHTSAGRIPTDKGYRYYVDRIMKTVDLPVRIKQQMRESLTKTGMADLHLLLETAARTLSRVTRQLCIIVAPSLSRALFRGVYVFPLGGHRYLMNITIDGGLVRNVVFELPEELPAETISTGCRVLVEIFGGRELIDLCRPESVLLNEIPQSQTVTVRRLLPPVRRIAESESAAGTYAEGASNVLLQPEFFSRERAENVKQMCDEPERLVDLVRAPDSERAGTVIRIGREIPRGAYHSFSVIKTGYRVGALPGSLGVIGPKRMPYPFLISAVEYMARELSEMYGR